VPVKYRSAGREKCNHIGSGLSGYKTGIAGPPIKGAGLKIYIIGTLSTGIIEDEDCGKG